MRREVVARNFATASENRIHSDEVAHRYGFKGGLVPGVTVYAYMHGEILQSRPHRVRFLKPVFDGELLNIHLQPDSITAERDGEICASLTPAIADLALTAIPALPLPDHSSRPSAEPATLLPGTVLGTLRTTLESREEADNLPAALLSLANYAFMANFRLTPWMHVGSEISPRGGIRWRDAVEVHSQIHACYRKKERDFVDLDMQITSNGRAVHSLRHTAIYRLE